MISGYESFWPSQINFVGLPSLLVNHDEDDLIFSNSVNPKLGMIKFYEKIVILWGLGVTGCTVSMANSYMAWLLNSKVRMYWISKDLLINTSNWNRIDTLCQISKFLDFSQMNTTLLLTKILTYLQKNNNYYFKKAHFWLEGFDYFQKSYDRLTKTPTLCRS